MLKTETAVFSRLSMRGVILDYILTPIGASGRASTLTKVSVTELHLLDLTQLKHWEVAAKGGSGIPHGARQAERRPARQRTQGHDGDGHRREHAPLLPEPLHQRAAHVHRREGISPVVARAKEMAGRAFHGAAAPRGPRAPARPAGPLAGAPAVQQPRVHTATAIPRRAARPTRRSTPRSCARATTPSTPSSTAAEAAPRARRARSGSAARSTGRTRR